MKGLYHEEIRNLNPSTNFCYSVIKPTQGQNIVNNSWKENDGRDFLFKATVRVRQLYFFIKYKLLIDNNSHTHHLHQLVCGRL